MGLRASLEEIVLVHGVPLDGPILKECELKLYQSNYLHIIGGLSTGLITFAWNTFGLLDY